MSNDHLVSPLATERCTVVISPSGKATLNGEALHPQNSGDITGIVLDVLQQRAQSAARVIEASILDSINRQTIRIRVAPNGASQVVSPVNSPSTPEPVSVTPDFDTLDLNVLGRFHVPTVPAEGISVAGDLADAIADIHLSIRSGDLTHAAELAAELRHIIGSRHGRDHPFIVEIMGLQAYVARLRGDHAVSTGVFMDLAEVRYRQGQPEAAEEAVQATTAWMMLGTSSVAVDYGRKLIALWEGLIREGYGTPQATTLVEEIHRRIQVRDTSSR